MMSCSSLTHLPTFAANEMRFPQISMLHNWLTSELLHLCKPIPFCLLSTPPTACFSSSISISSAITSILDMRMRVWIDFTLLQLLYHSFKVFPVSVPPSLSHTKASWCEKLASIKSNSYPPKQGQHFQTANYEWSLNGTSFQLCQKLFSGALPGPGQSCAMVCDKSCTHFLSRCHLVCWSHIYDTKEHKFLYINSTKERFLLSFLVATGGCLQSWDFRGSGQLWVCWWHPWGFNWRAVPDLPEISIHASIATTKVELSTLHVFDSRCGSMRTWGIHHYLVAWYI